MSRYMDNWCDYCKTSHLHTCDHQRKEYEDRMALQEAKEKERIEQEIVAFETMVYNMGEHRFKQLLNDMGVYTDRNDR